MTAKARLLPSTIPPSLLMAHAALLGILVLLVHRQPRAMSYVGARLLLNYSMPLLLAAAAQMFIIVLGDIDLGIGPSIVVTLGASFIWTGCAIILMPRPGGSSPEWLSTLVRGTPPLVPSPVYLALLVFGACWFLLFGSSYGAVARLRQQSRGARESRLAVDRRHPSRRLHPAIGRGCLFPRVHGGACPLDC